MTFRRDKDNETLLCLNNQVINNVTSCGYLGVTIDDELKWTDHIGQLKVETVMHATFLTLCMKENF